jgi:putative photosynthetic complex assembly protein
MASVKPASKPDTFPRGALLGAAGMIALALVAAVIGRVEGPLPDAAPSVAAAERDLRFEDRADGAIVVSNAVDGRVVEVVTGQSGFLRGTLRGLARARKLAGVGEQAPFHLTAWADGRVTLDDPSTDRHIDLEAFGPTNTAVFARLLTTPVADAGKAAP